MERVADQIVVAALISTVRPLRDRDTGDTRRDLFLMLSGLLEDLDERVGLGVLGVQAAIRPGSPLL
jgi:hypothetical protein